MYIVIWDYGNRDSHISVDSKGFIIEYASRDDAKEDSNECKDNEHYRVYKIIEVE